MAVDPLIFLAPTRAAILSVRRDDSGGYATGPISRCASSIIFADPLFKIRARSQTVLWLHFSNRIAGRHPGRFGGNSPDLHGHRRIVLTSQRRSRRYSETLFLVPFKSERCAVTPISVIVAAHDHIFREERLQQDLQNETSKAMQQFGRLRDRAAGACFELDVPRMRIRGSLATELGAPSSSAPRSSLWTLEQSRPPAEVLTERSRR